MTSKEIEWLIGEVYIAKDYIRTLQAPNYELGRRKEKTIEVQDNLINFLKRAFKEVYTQEIIMMLSEEMNGK